MLRVLFTYRIGRVMEIEKMITKKEDLMNTYIRNDNGELLELYIASCLEFGFHLSPAFNDSKLLDDEFMFISTGIDGNSVWAVNNRYDAMTSQLTISDLKPRTKTEFVKCEFSREWEAVRYYNEDGELFVVDCNGNYTNVNDISGAWYEVVCKNYHNIYRKVETEIDERQEFIEAYASLRHEFHGQRTYDDFSGFMFDSGKFKLVE